MTEKELFKKGYYTFYEITDKTVKTYRVDSGKTIFIARQHKYIMNPYRDQKDFKSLELAESYVKKKLKRKTVERQKKIEVIPKSLYLVLIREELSGRIFVKVGITAKRFIMRRFSKVYGYDGYIVESILRRIDTPDAADLEKEIKDKLSQNKSVKKYRPLLESFSGYSECFDYGGLDNFIQIFDEVSCKS